MTPYKNRPRPEASSSRTTRTSTRRRRRRSTTASGEAGSANEGAGGPPLWLERKHRITATVVDGGEPGLRRPRLPGRAPAGRSRSSTRRSRSSTRAATSRSVCSRSRRPRPRPPARWRSCTTSSPRTRARSGSTLARSTSSCSSRTTRRRRAWSRPVSATLKAREACLGLPAGLRREDGQAGRRRSTTHRTSERSRRPQGEWSDPQHRGEGRPGVQLVVLERDRRARPRCRSTSASRATRGWSGSSSRPARRSLAVPVTSGAWRSGRTASSSPATWAAASGSSSRRARRLRRPFRLERASLRCGGARLRLGD